MIVFQIVSFTFCSGGLYIKITKKGKWTLETSQRVSAGKGSRQRIAATRKSKACKRLQEVRKSLTILGNSAQRSYGQI